MSERAKRAAEVLAERGWGVYVDDHRGCHRCGSEMIQYARYCHNCGEPSRYFEDDTIADLEAAIAAAVDE